MSCPTGARPVRISIWNNDSTMPNRRCRTLGSVKYRRSSALPKAYRVYSGRSLAYGMSQG